MTYAVARDVNVAPAGHAGKRPVVRQGLQARPDIHRPARIQAGHRRHQPAADRGIAGWIRGAAAQVGKLKRVRVYRRVPLVR
jgi:hypothetical protein